jgi:hypothetical protein
LEQKLFEECYDHYLSDFSKGENWNSLAERNNFESGESLRWAFKNERKKRHIPGKNQQNNTQSNIKKFTANKPVVGVMDIETLPLIAMTFGIWQQNIGLEQIIEDICMLSWAGKFLNESEIYSDILTQKETKTRDTKRITQSCWDFLSKCDIVIGHNFGGFDRTHINNEFLKHDLPPLKYIVVDTLSVAKKNFNFTSNKMQFINDKLGLTSKMENDGFPLWRSCSDGDKESLDTMEKYNRIDILATEDIFYKMRPYINNFNVALYNEIDKAICPVCGSENLAEEGFYYTSAGKWTSIRCQDCKCISRGKNNLLSKTKKKSLLINS